MMSVDSLPETPAATVQLIAEDQDAGALQQQQHPTLQQHEPASVVAGAVLPSANAGEQPIAAPCIAGFPCLPAGSSCPFVLWRQPRQPCLVLSRSPNWFGTAGRASIQWRISRVCSMLSRHI